jgi:16S rRNA (uracil1498-N3)-methyltransferase
VSGVAIFDGQGNEATAEILAAKNNRVELRKISQSKSAPLACRLTLAQAIPKGKNMELIVEKATELGAAVIAPLLSERTVVRCDERKPRRRSRKWQAVALESCQAMRSELTCPKCGRRDSCNYIFVQSKVRPQADRSLQPDARRSCRSRRIQRRNSQNVLILVATGRRLYAGQR